MAEAYQTERVGDVIVQVVADMDPYNPREEGENITSFYGEHRHYTIGDGEPPSDEARALERGGIRLLYRWLRRYRGVVAFTKVGMYDHSGVSYYTVPLDPPSRGHHPQDFGGWDSGVVGYAYITRERAEELGAPTDSLDRQMEAEVAEYGDWASGNVWGYVITKPCADPHHEDDSDEDVADCPHSEELDSCYGFIGDPDEAMNEGKASAKSFLEKVPQGA